MLARPVARPVPSPRVVGSMSRAPAPFRVLFVCPPGGQESSVQRDALRRAYALARAFQGQLLVLRVLPGSPRHNVLLPHLSLLHAMGDLARMQQVLEETRAQCEPHAPGLLAEQIVVRQGGHIHEAYRAARELQASLIVLPRQRGVSGREAAWLASMSDVPVLVARPATRGEAIVAATDMLDPGYPVLRQAAAWSQRLESPLVCVHNEGDTPPGPSHAARSAVDLLQVAMRFGRDAESVVARRSDPVETILGEARTREADLVVVGVRPHTWLDLFSARGLATRLVDRARRSVLLTPIRTVA